MHFRWVLNNLTKQKLWHLTDSQGKTSPDTKVLQFCWMIVKSLMDAEVLQYCWLLAGYKSSRFRWIINKNFAKYKNYAIPLSAKQLSETQVARSCWFCGKNFAGHKSSAILLSTKDNFYPIKFWNPAERLANTSLNAKTQQSCWMPSKKFVRRKSFAIPLNV